MTTNYSPFVLLTACEQYSKSVEKYTDKWEMCVLIIFSVINEHGFTVVFFG